MLEEGDDELNDEDYSSKGRKRTKRSKQTPKQQRKEARLQKRKNKDKKSNQGKQQDFDVLHLTSDIRAKIDLLKELFKEASKSEFDRVLKFYDITVYREDLFNLTDEEWLNDNNLSFIYEYLSRIQIKPTLKARMKYCKDSDLNQIMLLMPTFSFLLAHHPDPKELVDVLPPIKDSSFVFLPVNDNDDLETPEGGSHWSLILCCPKDRKCFIYDSMYLANDQESHALVRQLEIFYGFQFEVITDKYTPQQINGSDCGVLLLCLSALLLSRILKVDNNTYIDLSMKNVSVSALDARLFILGYEVPHFPSLVWPTVNGRAQYNYLYYTRDIWKFTVSWSMIFMIGFYAMAALIAMYSQNKALNYNARLQNWKLNHLRRLEEEEAERERQRQLNDYEIQQKQQKPIYQQQMQIQGQSQDDGPLVNGKEGREEHGLRQRKKQQESYRQSSSNKNIDTVDAHHNHNETNNNGAIEMGNMNNKNNKNNNNNNNNSITKNNKPILNQTSTTTTSSITTSQTQTPTPTPKPHSNKYKSLSRISNYMSRRKSLLAIFFMYIIVGAMQSFVSGSLVGLLICAIYKSGAFKMNTWIPCVYGIIITLYNVITSYSLTIAIL
ncbi:unnamed protein product [Ambrosiozyma monospora]|uniref:Unnamed protein product n=1 Tax=Ambrosiozyma monospora TaxID=43982 RepID=A0A9W6YR68_AMBMO|nr:unnamed protein product [Ambrosiozyma monospora]